MAAPTRRSTGPLVVVLLIVIALAGLYLGYRWPRLTATGVLLALIGVWLIAERLTGRWWY